MDSAVIAKVFRKARLRVAVLLFATVAGSAVGQDGGPRPVRFELPPDSFPPSSIQFPVRPIDANSRFVTARELRVWARSRNLVLVDDCGLGGLRDGVAAVVPSTGLEFELIARGTGRRFLYLDIVSFVPLGAYRPHSMITCDTGRDQISFPGRSDVQLERPLWLEVSVNGKVLKTLYQGGGTFIVPPVRITVERDVPKHGKLKVRLLPSPGEAFFAVWDVMVSDSADEPATDQAEE